MYVPWLKVFGQGCLLRFRYAVFLPKDVINWLCCKVAVVVLKVSDVGDHDIDGLR